MSIRFYPYATKMREMVYLTTDIFQCVKLIEEEKQAVCNFGLPYIAQPQMELIKTIPLVIAKVEPELISCFSSQLSSQFHRFE